MRKTLCLLLGIVLALGLSARLAAAQNNNVFPPVDLPQDHWAYEAVKYMMDTGILEGYPGNEFRGARTMTRYEFAIALNRVALWIEATYGEGGLGADGQATLDALRTEFSTELADVQKQVDANTESIGDLEGSLGTMGERVDAIERRIGNITWKGDFLFRTEYQNWDDQGMDRFRERIRLRLDFSAPIVKDTLDFAGRISTGPGGVSTNQTLGNYNMNYGIGLDRAYMAYYPTWIPVKSTWYFGRYPNFLMGDARSGIVWDSDLNFDGTGQHFEIPFYGGDYQINAIQAILNEKAGALVEDDQYVLGWQLGAKDFFIHDFDWYASYYHYQNLVGGGMNFGADGYAGNIAGGGVDVNLDGALNNGDSIATKYDVLNIGGAYTFRLSENGAPIKVHGDYVANLNPAIPFATDTRLAVVNDDHWGMLAGFKYGEAKAKGSYDFGYYYKNVGATAVVGAFADADDYGANVEAHNLYFDYAIADNTHLAFEYILHNLKNNFGYLADDTRSTVILDLVVKF